MSRRGGRWARVAAALGLAAVAIVVAIGAAAPASWRAAVLDDAPGCLFRAATGLPCPFCGMTHATVALGAGDLAAAHAAHPLALVVLLATVGLLAVVAGGHADRLLRGRRPIALLVAIAAIWAVRLVA